MPDATYIQSSFGSGQWSQFSQGSFTDKRYEAAMNVCLNGFPAESQNWVRRPGTMQGGTTRNGAAGRVIEFNFEQNNPYTIEFTDGYMRFWNSTQLVVNADVQSVVGISAATPAVVETAAAHGWTTNQQFVFQNLSVGDPYLLNRQFIGTVVDSTHISLTDAVTGAALDGSLLEAFGTGQIARTVELGSPYLSRLWADVRSVQAEKKAVLLERSVAPFVLEATSPPSSAAPATFSLSQASFKDGPYLDPVVGATLTPASTSGIVGFIMASATWSSTAVYNDGDYVVKSGIAYQSLVDQNLNNDPATATWAWVVVSQDRVVGPNGLQPSDIGRMIRLFSEPLDWAVGTTYAAGTSVKYQNVYFTSIVSSNTGNIPGVDLTKWAITPSAAIWTWGKITSLTGAASSLVDPTLGTVIGSTVSPGHPLTASFNGVTNQTVANSTQWQQSATIPAYVGKDFSGGGGQAISYALVYAPNDYVLAIPPGGAASPVTLKLYGNATAPTSSNDGTLLGTTSLSTSSNGQVVQIFSSDAATAFNYLWIEYSTSVVSGIMIFSSAQVQFYTASAFTGTGISVQIMGPALKYTSAIKTWRLGLFTSATGYPTCGTYHEGRLWISGVVANRLDASALCDIYSNPAVDFFTFTPTLFDQTVTEACGISYTLDGPDVNALFWMQPDQQGIIVGTQAGEWLVQATTINSPLSPLNMQAHRVTKIGDANIEPRRTENTNVFVHRSKVRLMEYFADVFSGKFSAPNLAKDASNLANRRMAEITYQKDLVQILWMRCDDGSLIGATYKRDSLMTSSGPSINGWHDHVLGSGRLVKYICTGASLDGNFDALTMVTQDAATGINYVEAISNVLGEGALQSEAQYVDAAVPITATETVAIGAGFPYGGLKINGLWALNGKTVSAWLGGLDCGDYVVSNGSISVPYGDGIGGGYGSYPTPATNRYDQGLFTQDFVSTGITANDVTMFTGTMPVTVGFTYTSRGQLLRPIQPAETGSRNGPAFGKLSRGHYLMALFEGTGGGPGGVQMGYDFNALNPAIFKDDDDVTTYTVDQQFTGVFRDQFECDYTFETQPCWQISRPQICNVQAFGSARETADV